MHGGTQSTLAFLRQRSWIIGGRAPVKTHILRCVNCAWQRGIRAHQLMGQLPLCRVTTSRPFTHIGVDYAGPLTLKTWKGRGAKTQKGWICVFVCFSTSAVYCTQLIAAYRRFTSRRSIAAAFYSGCGTNFQGADSQLKKLFTQSTRENQDIAALLAEDGTQWHFNPPAAPHMGRKWEAVVKSLKFHLRNTVGDALLTYEESITLFAQIETILNSRPLEPLSDDPDDATSQPSHQDTSRLELSSTQYLNQRFLMSQPTDCQGGSSCSSASNNFGESGPFSLHSDSRPSRSGIIRPTKSR
ncbi:uncharacterized protein LOC117609795 [Osmia lignaria lignaria]|uniref:uncharacterized protein LOC117609795 n=1 Tax=Osmia lignaria lignaria TaxID=1437193 RepID=UPI0014784299|nr:uncharacterized protein LOC117609795 [Osmia lignaria]